jgi:hypothetical protein
MIGFSALHDRNFRELVSLGDDEAVAGFGKEHTR